MTITTKFRALADGLQADINHKLANRQTNTPKRQREAATARIEGWHMQRTQSALRALANAHEAGEGLAPCLATLKSKAEVHALMRSRIDRTNAGYYDAGIDTNKPATDTEQAHALWALIVPRSEAEEKAEALRLKIEGLQFANIPGYFPTPSGVVTMMMGAAEIPLGDCRVLEPSAGSGAIADRVKAIRPNAAIETIERNYTLIEILTAKGHFVMSGDFLNIAPVVLYERVLMNPPFENGQDADHVRHAFGFLKSGGRLVAIMSPGPFFRADRKAVAFREWFEERGGTRVDIPAGAFKESGTAVATVMVTIDA